MTLYEFAIYRYARMLMTPAELKYAQTLAGAADRGAPWAAMNFRALVDEVIYDKKRRPQRWKESNTDAVQ